MTNLELQVVHMMMMDDVVEANMNLMATMELHKKKMDDELVGDHTMMKALKLSATSVSVRVIVRVIVRANDRASVNVNHVNRMKVLRRKMMVHLFLEVRKMPMEHELMEH